MGVFVCEYQQGNMGLFSIKNNLVALKRSISVPSLLFLLLLLPSLILSSCVEANSLCTIPTNRMYKYAVQCIQQSVTVVSWVLWCKHSLLLETSKRSDPGGLFVSTRQSV